MVQKVEWKQIIDNTENYILSKTNTGAGTGVFFVKTEIKNSKSRSSYNDKKEKKNNP